MDSVTTYLFYRCGLKIETADRRSITMHIQIKLTCPSCEIADTIKIDAFRAPCMNRPIFDKDILRDGVDCDKCCSHAVFISCPAKCMRMFLDNPTRRRHYLCPDCEKDKADQKPKSHTVIVGSHGCFHNIVGYIKSGLMFVRARVVALIKRMSR